MSEYPWSKFFWSDWEADQGLRLCSLAAQGLWMRMLCVCARHEPKGYLAINGNPLSVDAIARLVGVTETEAGNLLAELETNGVFSRDRNRRIYSRRMVRDEKRSQEGRKHKKRGLAQAAENTNKNPPPSRGPSRGPSPQKPEARSQKDKIEADASISRATADPKPPGFPEFWDAYPHRGGSRRNRSGAEAKFRAAVRSGTDPALIVAGAHRAHHDQRVRDGFARDPTTWINQRGWEDEIAPPTTILTPITGGQNVQLARPSRDAARTDALRDTLHDAGRMRRTSEPNWL